MKTSCVLALYNGSKYISEMLHSIINQSVKVDEIIIVDDASTDNSLEIVNEIIYYHSDQNIKLILNNINLGVVKTFERALKESCGELIFLADQDDVWIENKVGVILAHATNNPEIDLFYSDGYIVNENLCNITLISSHFYLDYIYKSKKRIRLAYELGNFVPGCTMALRRTFVDSHLPIPQNIISLHDGWFAHIAHFKNTSFYINEKLIKYRQHENNYSGTKKKSLKAKLSRLLDYEYRYQSVIKHENEYYQKLKVFQTDDITRKNLINRYYYFETFRKFYYDNSYFEKHLSASLKLLFDYTIHFRFRYLIKILIFEVNLYAKKFNISIKGASK